MKCQSNQIQGECYNIVFKLMNNFPSPSPLLFFPRMTFFPTLSEPPSHENNAVPDDISCSIELKETCQISEVFPRVSESESEKGNSSSRLID